MPRGPDPEYTAADILRAFTESPDPVLFAGEVAAEFGKSRQWAYDNLDELVEEGYLLTKKAGERTRIYWISREGKQYLRSERCGQSSNQ